MPYRVACTQCDPSVIALVYNEDDAEQLVQSHREEKDHFVSKTRYAAAPGRVL